MALGQLKIKRMENKRTVKIDLGMTDTIARFLRSLPQSDRVYVLAAWKVHRLTGISFTEAMFRVSRIAE